MSAPVELLLVRGAPGVGKSSAVSRLRRNIPGGATIEVDDLRRMIAGVQWSGREHHTLAIEHARLLAESFFARGFSPVVVVDTFSRRLAEPLATQLRRIFRIASLHAAPHILERRIEGRPVSAFRDVSVSLALNAEVLRERLSNDELIDTTHLDVDAVSSRLAMLLGVAP